MTNSEKNFVTIEEFINIAIQFEIDSAEFYRGTREQVTDENAREVLILLEKEEIGHQKTLIKFDIGEEKHGILQFPPSLSLSMPEIESETPEMDAILEIGLARERKAVEIYENAASMVSGKFRDLLVGLANFEKQHVEKLRSLKALLL